MVLKDDTGNLNYEIDAFLRDALLLIGIARTVRELPMEDMLRMIELVEVKEVHLGNSRQAKLVRQHGRLIRAAVDFQRGIADLELADKKVP